MRFGYSIRLAYYYKVVGMVMNISTIYTQPILERDPGELSIGGRISEYLISYY